MFFNLPFKIEFKNIFDLCLECVGLKIIPDERYDDIKKVKLENTCKMKTSC